MAGGHGKFLLNGHGRPKMVLNLFGAIFIISFESPKHGDRNHENVKQFAKFTSKNPEL